MAVLQAMLAVCRGISLKIEFSNYLLVAVLQARLAVCKGYKDEKSIVLCIFNLNYIHFAGHCIFIF